MGNKRRFDCGGGKPNDSGIRMKTMLGDANAISDTDLIAADAVILNGHGICGKEFLKKLAETMVIADATLAKLPMILVLSTAPGREQAFIDRLFDLKRNHGN